MPATRVRDRLWLWSHVAGAYNGQYHLPGESHLEPSEAVKQLGVANAVMVIYADQPRPPFDSYAQAFAPLRQVVWSIIGDSSSHRNNTQTDLPEVIELASRFPNITGAVMDDFFHAPKPDGRFSRWSVADVAAFHRELNSHSLDLWVVVYAHDLVLPITEYLQHCDVLTFWTWRAQELADLETNFARLEALAPHRRKLLGCYLWDFGTGKPMPLDALRRQCELGYAWLQSGRIEGMVFVSGSVCDLSLETVDWLKRWIAEVPDLRVTA